MKMPIKQAIAEVILEEALVIGMVISLCGRLFDGLLGVFPAFTVFGFPMGFLLYVWAENHLKSIEETKLRTNK